MATVPSVQEPSASPPSPFPYGDEKIGGEKKMASGIEEEQQGQNGSEPLLVAKGIPLEVKRFIVESFACFQGLMAIKHEVKKRYGLDIDERWIAKYDAQRPHSSMGRALRTLYAETRKAYIEGTAEVAIAHQAHRLRLVGRIVEKATTSKDYAAALKGLELAAKEMGGALSGQQVIRHEGMIGHVHATVEEARAEISARLAQVVEGGLLLPHPAPMATPPDPAPPTVEASPTEGTPPA